MSARRFALLIAVLALAGCDRITGADKQKTFDAEAIGYACRVSLKPPEDCMKENESHSPTSILYGWKEADRDIREKAIDPNMGKNQPAPQAQQSAPATAETADRTATGKASEPIPSARGEKPAATDKDAAEKKASH